MNVSADKFRAATRLARIAALAAAATAAIVVAGSVTAGSSLASSGNGQFSNPSALKPGASADSFAGVPAYYVALGNPSLAIVRATATGATLVRITAHTPFVGVAGAANDRTFVLDAQRQIIGPSVSWPGRPQFSLLRLTASGTEESYTRLALAPLPKGAAVTGLALTPDGSKLAVAFELGNWPKPRDVMEIRVYTLATGAYRTWSALGSADSEDPGGFTGSGTDGSESISWSADSRTLAFDWMNGSLIGVRLLDTAASEDNLIADSRLAVIEMNFASHSGPPTFPFPSKDDVSQCVTDSIMSLDGSAIVCGYATTTELPGDTFESTTGYIRYSTGTGKPTALVGVYQFQGQVGGDITLLWTNSTGTIAIGSIGTPRGMQTEVINDEKFTPLPESGDLNGAAW